MNKINNRKIQFLIFFLLLSSSAISQKNNLIKLKVTIENLNGASFSDLDVILKTPILKNVVVPKVRFFGFDYDDLGFYIVHLEKKGKNKYLPFPHSALYHSPLEIPEALDTVIDRDIKDSFYIGDYYSSLKKGSYRIKITAFFHRYNTNIPKEVTTSWKYFKVSSQIRPYIYRKLE
jgi:hypothetical protein